MDLTGETLGGSYRVEGVLGEGGMGAVYRATDKGLGRQVALKVIRADRRTSAQFVGRFQREARVLAQVRHPNLVEIYAFGEDEPRGLLFMALELVEGTDLDKLVIQNGAIPVEHAVSIVRQVLDGLEAAHAHGIVHRDLKPANVMLMPDGRVKLLDFGLARYSGEKDGESISIATRPGALMGTPQYMSPEQARGEPVDLRTDIYTVGLILYELLAGACPFDGETVSQLLAKHMNEPPPVPPLRSKNIPADLERVVFKALKKKPDDRYASARLFAADLDAVMSGGRPAPETLAQTPPPRTPFITPKVPTPFEAPAARNVHTAGTLIEPGIVFDESPAPAGEDAASTTGTPDLTGRTIDGRYEVVGSLSSGGMGAVFKARHKLLDKLVALKVMHSAFAERRDVRERFLREARATMEFTHPNAIPVRDVGITPDGLLYMTQDLSPGRSLRAVLDELRRIPAPRALGIARQCLLALDEAHRHGIIHRDLKPDNILVEISSDGRDVARICDFGVAKLISGDSEEGPEGKRLTGQLAVGTPDYMAPEQAAGESVDGRSDIYAMGCVLYEMVTGARLFRGTPQQILAKQVTQVPEAPTTRAPDVSPAVEALVLHALEKDPGKRPASASAFVAELDRVLAQGLEPGSARRRPPVPSGPRRIGEGETVASSYPVPRSSSRHAVAIDPKLAATMQRARLASRREELIRSVVVTCFIPGAIALGIGWFVHSQKLGGTSLAAGTVESKDAVLAWKGPGGIAVKLAKPALAHDRRVLEIPSALGSLYTTRELGMPIQVADAADLLARRSDLIGAYVSLPSGLRVGEVLRQAVSERELVTSGRGTHEVEHVSTFLFAPIATTEGEVWLISTPRPPESLDLDGFKSARPLSGFVRRLSEVTDASLVNAYQQGKTKLLSPDAVALVEASSATGARAITYVPLDGTERIFIRDDSAVLAAGNPDLVSGTLELKSDAPAQSLARTAGLDPTTLDKEPLRIISIATGSATPARHRAPIELGPLGQVLLAVGAIALALGVIRLVIGR